MASKTELAKAYVEIIPSATGIGGKISEALGGEVTAAGATAGQSLGKSLIGMLGKDLKKKMYDLHRDEDGIVDGEAVANDFVQILLDYKAGKNS